MHIFQQVTVIHNNISFAWRHKQPIYFFRPQWVGAQKATICIYENKGADQLYCKADQRLCFRYTNSTIPLLSKSKTASSHLLCLYSWVCVGTGWKPHCWVSHMKAQMYTVHTSAAAGLCKGKKKKEIIIIMITVIIESVHEKAKNLGSDQVRHKSGCTVIEDG